MLTLVDYNAMFNSTYVYSNTGESHGWTQKDTKAATFETANGESIMIYYNPLCDAGKYEANGIIYMTQPKICVNMIFDLNGTKGPNTFGKDIGFMSAIYSSDSVVVMPTVTKVLSDSTTQLAAWLMAIHHGGIVSNYDRDNGNYFALCVKR